MKKRLIKLGSDPEKDTRKLKFGPDLPNNIKSYPKKSPLIASGKHSKIIISNFSQDILILTNISQSFQYGFHC